MGSRSDQDEIYISQDPLVYIYKLYSKSLSITT